MWRRIPCLVKSGPKQLLQTEIACVKVSLLNLYHNGRCVGHKFQRQINYIHFLFPVHFPVRETFFEGGDTVDIGTVAFPDLLVSRLPYSGFNFSCTMVFKGSYYFSWLLSPLTCPPHPLHDHTVGRGQVPDVYMTSRLLVLGSAYTFILSVVHLHTHTQWLQARTLLFSLRIAYIACDQTVSMGAKFCGNCISAVVSLWRINPLMTKGNLFYIRTQLVPRCKHSPPQLRKPISYWCIR
jgi:hypothetical protein